MVMLFGFHTIFYCNLDNKFIVDGWMYGIWNPCDYVDTCRYNFSCGIINIGKKKSWSRIVTMGNFNCTYVIINKENIIYIFYMHALYKLLCL